MEDLTDPEAIRLDPKCDRTVSLYGYLRGTFLKNKCQVHVPGKISFIFTSFFIDIYRYSCFASGIIFYIVHVTTQYFQFYKTAVTVTYKLRVRLALLQKYLRHICIFILHAPYFRK